VGRVLGGSSRSSGVVFECWEAGKGREDVRSLYGDMSRGCLKVGLLDLLVAKEIEGGYCNYHEE